MDCNRRTAASASTASRRLYGLHSVPAAARYVIHFRASSPPFRHRFSSPPPHELLIRSSPPLPLRMIYGPLEWQPQPRWHGSAPSPSTASMAHHEQRCIATSLTRRSAAPPLCLIQTHRRFFAIIPDNKRTRARHIFFIISNHSFASPLLIPYRLLYLSLFEQGFREVVAHTPPVRR